MIEQLIEYDRELFLFLNNLGSSGWDPFWLLLTDKWSAIPLYAVLLFLIYKKYGVKGTLITMVLVALMITCTDQLANLFKHGIERLRPCGQEGVKEYTRFIAVRCGSFGFFSGHASNSTALAVFVGLILKKFFPKLIYFLIFWALMVTYSRIYVGVHYPLDLITGMFFGTLLGLLFTYLHRFSMTKFKITF
jgi:undecaprenyl-diphosphatase